MLPQHCVHADMLQDLSGKPGRKRTKLLRGLIDRVTPIVQYYGLGEALAILAKVQLHLDC